MRRSATKNLLKNGLPLMSVGCNRRMKSSVIPGKIYMTGIALNKIMTGFSHTSPLWPDGFHQLEAPFQAMTSKPPIWKAPSRDAWLSGCRHPDPHTLFPVRITGYSNQNSHVNYSELLQLEKDWGNSVSDHFNI